MGRREIKINAPIVRGKLIVRFSERGEKEIADHPPGTDLECQWQATQIGGKWLIDIIHSEFIVTEKMKKEIEDFLRSFDVINREITEQLVEILNCPINEINFEITQVEKGRVCGLLNGLVWVARRYSYKKHTSIEWSQWQVYFLKEKLTPKILNLSKLIADYLDTFEIEVQIKKVSKRS